MWNCCERQGELPAMMAPGLAHGFFALPVLIFKMPKKVDVDIDH